MCACNTFVRVLRPFSIQLKFLRGQKIMPDFRTEHAQSWHLKNRSEKDEKKVENFQFPWRILEKKIINQKNGSQQCENSFPSTQWG